MSLRATQERLHKETYTGESLPVSTFVIQTDRPEYRPPSAKQVEELAERFALLKGTLRESLSSLLTPEKPSQQALTSSADRQIAEKFQRLSDEWRSKTAYASSILEIATTPEYQQIIGMGRAVVPLILQELARSPDHWFWALKAITGEDPVPEQDRGNFEKMTGAWLAWGAANGYTIQA